MDMRILKSNFGYTSLAIFFALAIVFSAYFFTAPPSTVSAEEANVGMCDGFEKVTESTIISGEWKTCNAGFTGSMFCETQKQVCTDPISYMCTPAGWMIDWGTCTIEDYAGSCDTSTCFPIEDDSSDDDNSGPGPIVVTNNPPSITLLGSNPMIIKVGTQYNDPGATATDVEDGNLTNSIVVNGVVDYFKTGTYAIEYKVSDSKGATTSVYREVIVEDIFGDRGEGTVTICHATASASNPYIKITISENAIRAHREHHDGKDIIPAPAEGCPTSITPPTGGPYIDLSCKITSPEQLGWYGTYYNYASTTLGMSLPTSQWSNSYGDPLSMSSAWTANWYDTTFARFSRIDSSLMFGSNFFPFNLHPEELTNGKEHYFGARWEANVFASTSGSYSFTISSDDDSWIYVNGVLVADNSGVHPIKTINGIANLNQGKNIVQIFFAERHVTESVMNFKFNDSSLVIKPYSNVCIPLNTPPTITLVGNNPITINVNTNFTDPGATANDLEDGNLTSQIVITGSVSTTTVGTYTLTYSVTDSQGLSASTTRQVIVRNPTTPPPAQTGKINICLLLGDEDNNILTSRTGLPEGTFSIKLATSTNFASSTILSKTWNTNDFMPNRKVILGQNDADCVSISNLPILNYIYSELTVNGTLWNTPKYNDQHTTSVMSVLDFVLYDATGNSGTNADGQITLASNRTERTLVIYVNHDELPTPPSPTVTLSANPSTITVGNSSTLTWTSTNATSCSAVWTNNTATSGSFVVNPGSTTIYTINCFGNNATTTATTTVTVNTLPPVLSEPTVTLSANPSTITVGNSSTLTWTSTNATSCSAVWTNNTATSGSFVVNPGSTTIYTINCFGNNATTTATTTVTVNNGGGGTPTNPQVSLSANPSTITQGATSTLTWSSTNTTKCSATWTTSTSTSGSMIVSPATTTDYVINCFGNNATTTATTTVTVNTLPPVLSEPTVTLSANPSTITVGNSSTLTWTSTNATSCSAVWTNNTATSGSFVVNPGSTTIYTINCFGNNATTTATTTVTVNPTTPPSGGGGGGSISGGRRDISNLLAPQGEILGVTSCMYLRDHLKMGWNNDLVEMLKLKSFLNIFEKENLILNGDFDQSTFDAVSRFQNKYFSEVLAPWGHDAPTGFVYITTKKKINEIYCNTTILLTAEQQAEIEAFRNFIKNNYGEDVSGSGVGVGSTVGSVIVDPNVAGKDLGKVVTLETEGSEVSTTTALGSDSMLRNIAASVFAFPQKIFEDGKLMIISLIVIALVVIAIRSWIKSSKVAIMSNSQKGSTAPFVMLPSSKEKKENKNDILPDEEIIIDNDENIEDQIKQK